MATKRPKPPAAEPDWLADEDAPDLGMFGRNLLTKPAPGPSTFENDADGVPVLTERIESLYAQQFDRYGDASRVILAKAGIDIAHPTFDEVNAHGDRVRVALLIVLTLEYFRHRHKQGDLRATTIHAFELGCLCQRLEALEFRKYIHQAAGNALKLRRPQQAQQIDGLARLVEALPSVQWRKTSSAVAKLAQATGIKERSLWTYLRLLREADEPLIRRLAETTRRTPGSIRKILARIPAGKKLTAMR